MKLDSLPSKTKRKSLSLTCNRSESNKQHKPVVFILGSTTLIYENDHIAVNSLSGQSIKLIDD